MCSTDWRYCVAYTCYSITPLLLHMCYIITSFLLHKLTCYIITLLLLHHSNCSCSQEFHVGVIQPAKVKLFCDLGVRLTFIWSLQQLKLFKYLETIFIECHMRTDCKVTKCTVEECNIWSALFSVLEIMKCNRTKESINVDVQMWYQSV